MNRQGFTLTELMMTVVIVGILATLALPSLTRPVEAGYWRSARDILITTYMGEKVYYHLNGSIYIAPIGSSTSAADNAAWSAIYMENPNGGLPITFGVEDPGPGENFMAWAKRNNTGQCIAVTDVQKNPLVTGPASRGCTSLWVELP